MAVKIAHPIRYPRFSDMVTQSPPVSPNVVAAILMIQKPSVTAGTLLRESWNSERLRDGRAVSKVIGVSPLRTRYEQVTARCKTTAFTCTGAVRMRLGYPHLRGL